VIAGISTWILSLGGAAALAIVFLVPALEASAFLGFVFPGEIAVLLGGVLAFNGRVSLLGVIVAAVLGAILGDTIGYLVGRRWGHRILRTVGRRVPFLRRRIDEHLETATSYLRHRGGIAIFLGRFTAALRVMVPGLAGMAEMPYGEFFVYNAAGGVLWGTGFVLLGFFAGAAWERVAGYASRVGLGLLVLILVGLVAARFLRGMRERGEPVPDRFARVRPIAWTRRRFPRHAAWLARRIDTGSPRGFMLSFVVLAGTVCGWAFVGITQDVLANEEAVNLDPGIERYVVAHRAGWLTAGMKTVTWLGSNAVLIPVLAGIAAYVLVRRRAVWAAGFLLAAVAGSNVLYQVAKPLVGRARPPASLHLISVSGYAFPSGHATAAIACWGAAALVLGLGRSTRRKVVLWSAGSVIALLVSLSRLYLGVHWWTDVVGGLALGGLWLCVLGLVVVLRGSRGPEVDRQHHRVGDGRSDVADAA
jgi:membrane protein DedA with SNARE-associated domain/membrane-associated phospholipid phosphatase